jgi:DNA polymerase I
MTAPRLFLIDGSNQMYRAYHAIRGLTGPDGKSTNAIYGFVTMLRKLIADNNPELIACSFDLAGPTFRRDMAADYKATRSPMPPDLVEQVPHVHDVCAALGVPILTYERYEADDVLATLAMKAAQAGYEVALVTGDKDFFQLVGCVDGRIKVYNPKDDGTWFDPEGVVTKFGVRPDQVVDVLALMGDSIDNVKGVPGIGEKGARDLIAAHGTLDALLENAATVTQKRYREALLANADQARQSRELVRLHTDVPVDFNPDDCKYAGANAARCFELFSKFGFRSLVMEYAPTAQTVTKDYAAIDSLDGLDALVKEAREAGAVAMHLVTDTPTAMRAEIVGVTLSFADRQARYVPLARANGAPNVVSLSPAPAPDLFGDPEAAAVAATAVGAAAGAGPARDLFGDTDVAASAPTAPAKKRGAAKAELPPDVGGLDRVRALEILKPLFEDAEVAKTGHDLKNMAIVLARQGIKLRGVETDTILVSYVLDATRSDHRLEDLALEELTYRMTDEEELRGKGVKALPFERVPLDKMLTYAGERADLTWQLGPKMSGRMNAADLGPVYHELELPLVPVLIAIEMAGVRVDASALSQQATLLDRELTERADRIYGMAGETFNINSPKQLGDVLFVKLNMPVLKRTGAARTASTAQEVLEELALSHDLPREVLEWRALQKLKGTYVDALPQLVHPRTGRVHTSFSQATAATGRLSSSDPNLQNVPIRTEVGREIRRAFVAERDHLLISADYSQIELRVLAHLAGEESLIEAFRKGEDIHDRTALAVFGPDSGLSKHELRRRAKIINYALLYGKTAFTLSKDINVSKEEAQAFIDAYFAGFPAVRKFLDDTIDHARATGVVMTMFGRRRLVPDINNRNGMVRSAAERVAVNMPIQGTAADILKRAMIDVHAALGLTDSANPDARARMILTVHDELLFEVKKEAADEVAALVREKMEAAVALNVPLTVDVGIGENWKEAKD